MSFENEKDLGPRLVRIREILTGEKGDRGIQAWFRREIATRTGWEPGKASVHRWIVDGVDPPERARNVLGNLEREAREELTRKLDALEAPEEGL